MKTKAMGACVAVVGGLSAGAVGAESLMFAHSYPATHMITVEGMVPFVDCVAQKTNGALTVEHIPGGSIVNQQGSLDALNKGVTQITNVLPSYQSEKLPLNGIPLLPGFGATASENVPAWRKAATEAGPMKHELDANKLHPLLFSSSPAYQVMSVTGPVETLEDFKGLKLRVAGGSSILMAEALGATPVSINTADMFVAMQRETVDATALGLTSIKAYGIQELLKAISTNGSFGSGASILAIDSGVYDALPAEQKTVVDQCGLDAETRLAAALDKASKDLETEFAGMGITMYEFSPEVLQAISARLEGVGADYAKRLDERGLPAGQALEQFKAAFGK